MRTLLSDLSSLSIQVLLIFQQNLNRERYSWILSNVPATTLFWARAQRFRQHLHCAIFRSPNYGFLLSSLPTVLLSINNSVFYNVSLFRLRYEFWVMRMQMFHINSTRKLGPYPIMFNRITVAEYNCILFCVCKEIVFYQFVMIYRYVFRGIFRCFELNRCVEFFVGSRFFTSILSAVVISDFPQTL